MSNIQIKSALGRIWLKRDVDERHVYKYINDYGLSDLLARIIIARKVPEDSILSFLTPKIKDLLPDPFHLLDMDLACTRVAKAIENNEKIIVLGDYDVDGATSSALLMRLLKSLGANAEVYIPDRVKEGYGPSPELMEKFAQNKASVVITVDCGITAFDSADRAKELGIDLIILDHHISDVILPNAHAVVNPNRFDETTDLKNLAAVGVAFIFSVGLVKIFRDSGYFASKEEPDLLSLLDLVALGTICDMMSLNGLNRAFVIQGLKILSKGKNLGLKLLSDYGRIDTKPTAYHLGFVIGPRINAGGRVGKSYLGTHLLSTDDPAIAAKFASELEQYNEDRKIIEQQVYEEAIEMAESQASKNFILLHSENWHQGVIGIVAGKIKERFQKPVAAIAVDGEIGKASCRSVRGIDMGSKIVEAKKRDIILSGGGHAMAAGFTVHRSKIGDLDKFLNEAVDRESAKLEENNTCFYDAEVSSDGLSIDLAKEIEKLEPYGNGNSEPIIRINNVFVLKANVSNGKHITCILSPTRDSIGSKSIKAISFNSYGTEVGDLLLSERPRKLSILGYIKVNNWQGNSYPQVSIYDIIADE